MLKSYGLKATHWSFGPSDNIGGNCPPSSNVRAMALRKDRVVTDGRSTEKHDMMI